MKKKGNNKPPKQKQIILWLSITVLVLSMCLLGFVGVSFVKYGKEDISSVESVLESSEPSTSSNDSRFVTRGEYILDAEYTELLLVNENNPLPKGFSVEDNLITVDDKYINGNLKQINKNVWPYMKAMIEAAWAEDVELFIWSPYRSFDTQNGLYEDKVKRLMQEGLKREEAEIKAATVVAKAGTSEHQTGLCADFNMANDRFEKTKEYEWLLKNAEDYGFVMRYSAEKQSITGIIKESWHWRFVGINAAKEMNESGLCLEEYINSIKQ